MQVALLGIADTLVGNPLGYVKDEYARKARSREEEEDMILRAERVRYRCVRSQLSLRWYLVRTKERG